MLKGNKGKIIIASLILLGVILILLGSFQGKSNNESPNDEYVSTLELKLEEFLRGVDGIKDADVIIMLDEYEFENDNSSSVFAQDNGSATTTIPKIRGVAVAVSNGDDYSVQVKVTGIVSSYLGIPSNKIKIVALG